MYRLFLNAATYCEEAFGSPIIENEDTGAVEAFVCPNCGDPIYYEDWSSTDTENWHVCPICGEEFGDD